MSNIIQILRKIGVERAVKISVSQVKSCQDCSLRAILSCREFNKVVLPTTSKRLSIGTMGHLLIQNMPTFFKSQIQEGAELKEVDDFKECYLENFEQIWDWSMADMKAAGKIGEYDHITKEIDEILPNLRSRTATFIVKYSRALKPFLFQEKLLADNEMLVGTLDRYYYDFTLADWKFTDDGEEKNRERYALNIGGYTYLLNYNGHSVLKAELVLPKLTVCQTPSFNFTELKGLQTEFCKQYKELQKRFRDFIHTGAFDKMPFIDQNDCKYCFVVNTCNILHGETEEELGIKVKMEELQ